jgi:hypothetical protein
MVLGRVTGEEEAEGEEDEEEEVLLLLLLLLDGEGNLLTLTRIGDLAVEEETEERPLLELGEEEREEEELLVDELLKEGEVGNLLGGEGSVDVVRDDCEPPIDGFVDL